jgi:hypothetical protein
MPLANSFLSIVDPNTPLGEGIRVEYGIVVMTYDVVIAVVFICSNAIVSTFPTIDHGSININRGLPYALAISITHGCV